VSDLEVWSFFLTYTERSKVSSDIAITLSDEVNLIRWLMASIVLTTPLWSIITPCNKKQKKKPP